MPKAVVYVTGALSILFAILGLLESFQYVEIASLPGFFDGDIFLGPSLAMAGPVIAGSVLALAAAILAIVAAAIKSKHPMKALSMIGIIAAIASAILFAIGWYIGYGERVIHAWQSFGFVYDFGISAALSSICSQSVLALVAAVCSLSKGGAMRLD